jgi:predicted membrane metal-binding protein
VALRQQEQEQQQQQLLLLLLYTSGARQLRLAQAQYFLCTGHFVTFCELFCFVPGIQQKYFLSQGKTTRRLHARLTHQMRVVSAENILARSPPGCADLD